MSLVARLTRLENQHRPPVDLRPIILAARWGGPETRGAYLVEVLERLSEPCPPSGLMRRIWEARQRAWGRRLEDKNVNLRGRVERLC